MEQIQQHEWTRPKDAAFWLKVCPHCKVRRILASEGGFLYKVINANGKLEIKDNEPACITRTINAPLREADKQL